MSATFRVADLEPAAPGVNVMLIVQAVVAATLPPHLFVGLVVTLKSEAFVPVTAMELIVIGNEPVFVKVVVCAVLAAFTS